MGQYQKQNNLKMFQTKQPKNPPSREQNQPPAEDRGDLQPIDPIRVETVFSKLPIHQLSKRTTTQIRLLERDTRGGHIALRWQVSYNNHHGPPRQLAYKFEKLVLDPIIDQTARPLPRYIRLGDLRQIARKLRLGGDTAKVKKVLHQNASTYITAKLSYKDSSGKTHSIEVSNTRYRLIIKGSPLPDGSIAETAYIAYNDPFHTVINNTKPRPTDRNYLEELSHHPMSQRLYELLSFKFFACLKYHHTHALMTYSVFCARAPQKRNLNLRRAQKQMYEVHRPHLKSGYITKVRWQRTTDEQGSPDWSIFYTPGPKAYAEYDTFSGTKPRIPAAKTLPTSAEVGDTPQPKVNKKLLKRLTDPAHGVSDTVAYRLLSDITPDHQEHIADSIDYWDSIQTEKGTGLLVDLIRKNITLPASFETRAQRRQRQAEHEAEQRRIQKQQWLQTLYQSYKLLTIEQWVKDNVPAEEFQARLDKARATLRSAHSSKPSKTFEAMALGAARSYYTSRVPLMSFDDFRNSLADQKKADERLRVGENSKQNQPQNGSDEPTTSQEG